MLQTRLTLVNSDLIEKILIDIVKTAYDNVKNISMLLYIDKDELNIMVATEGNEDFEEAIKDNFHLDEDGDIIDQKGYYELLQDLQIEFIKMYKTCGLFDFFPSGYYEINDVQRLQNSDTLAPRGRYYAPFEESILIVH